jgi:hypothetical protein
MAPLISRYLPLDFGDREKRSEESFTERKRTQKEKSDRKSDRFASKSVLRVTTCAK